MKLLTVLLLLSSCAFAQDLQPTPSATLGAGKMRIFVKGNNPTATVVREELQQIPIRQAAYLVKHPNKKFTYCLEAVEGPDSADATLDVDSVIVAAGMGFKQLSSSANLTGRDGNLIWTWVGDGSKAKDAAMFLIYNLETAVCKK
jgi:hypothetical protein